MAAGQPVRAGVPRRRSRPSASTTRLPPVVNQRGRRILWRKRPCRQPPRIADVDGRWQKRRRHERYWKDLEAILGVRGGDHGASGGGPGASWGPLGCPRAFWSVLGSSWGRLGPSRGRLGRSWGRLGANLGRLGPCWARLGASWASLGPSWAVLAASWRALEGRPGLGARLERNPCKS